MKDYKKFRKILIEIEESWAKFIQKLFPDNYEFAEYFLEKVDRFFGI